MSKRRIDVRPPSDLEEALGYTFQNPALLRQALTHASAIHENHPDAFNLDLAPLAFVGDSALKYAVARYLFLNGLDTVSGNPDQMHKGAQRIIRNKILGEIGQQKLHLEEYLIRGNAHPTPSMKMYADCMEAILGAIALDCGTDQQAAIFCVIEKLCADRYEEFLKETTSCEWHANSFEDLNTWIGDNDIDWPKHELSLAIHGRKPISSRHEKSCWQMLGRICLWIFAVLGFLVFCFGLVNLFKLITSEVRLPRRSSNL